MKKLAHGLIVFLMIFSLSGCSKEKTKNTVIEPENQSINEQEQSGDLPQTQETSNENPETKVETTKNGKSNQSIDSMLKSLDGIDLDDDSSSLDTIEEEGEDSSGLDEIEE